jgi:hypothetical protein
VQCVTSTICLRRLSIIFFLFSIVVGIDGLREARSINSRGTLGIKTSGAATAIYIRGG